MIVDRTNSAAKEWAKNCFAFTLFESDALSIKQEQIAPGAAEQPHYHQQSTQFFYILSGKAAFVLQDQHYDLIAGQGIAVQPLQLHVICNKEAELLEFLVITAGNHLSDRINQNNA